MAGSLRGSGNHRRITWGFNPVDITRTKICLSALGTGIKCGEKGCLRFLSSWWILWWQHTSKNLFGCNLIYFTLCGRVTWGNSKQIIWGFNTVDITPMKMCIMRILLGIKCGEKGRIRFPSIWCFHCQSRHERLKQVQDCVYCTTIFTVSCSLVF